MLKLLSFLAWRKPRPALRRAVAPSWLTADAPAVDDEQHSGCGWFDSSHELERGLQVREADAQALCALPLSDWLDLELRAWCGHPQPG